MSQTTSLQDLILGYCEQVGGLVEPPAYGVHEVLLPEEIAARWGVAAHQRFLFAEESQSSAAEGEALRLHYGHPLVEKIVDELRRRTANSLSFINNVRLEKPGLLAVIEKTLQIPNSRVFAIPGAMERRRLYHYVRFNFKASLIADEKREVILPVWMHLQSGCPVRAEEIERLAALDAANEFRHLDPGEVEWLPTPPANPLSEAALRPLLERARLAARAELGEALQSMEKRLQRYLELDRARLQQYYDDLAKDAEKRLHKAEEERRPALEAKLAAIETERKLKLADVEEKYRLRIELELVNLAVIAQPKLDLRVEIKRRSVSTQRRVIWDPLLHLVEPLTCDVCGMPGAELHLCENGHLAHAGCLAAQCVECKRVFCQRCAESVQACVVCGRAVCVHSLARCPQCQRITCHDHLNLCHAADGAPQAPTPPGEATSPAAEKRAPASRAAESKATAEAKAGAEAKAAAPRKTPPKSKAPPAAHPEAPAKAAADRIDVYSDPANDRIVAYVLVKKHELAVRSWQMTDSGILLHCRCEKEHCAADSYYHRPAPADQIEAQMGRMIEALRSEYQVPPAKIHYYHVRQEQPFEERKLKLPARWKDPAALAEATQGFLDLYKR